MGRFTALFLTAYAALALVGAATVQAHDPDAPRGAGHTWLPCTNWVMFHWVPYDEAEFNSLAGTTTAEVDEWLRDDERHSLGTLLADRGKDPEVVTDQLAARWLSAGPEHHALMRARIRAMMRNPHLSQHVLFHYFHNPAISQHSRSIMKYRPSDYWAARILGFSPRQIGKRTGVSVGKIGRRGLAVIDKSVRAGVASNMTTVANTDRFMTGAAAWVPTWIDQHLHDPRGKRLPRGTRELPSRAAQICRYFGGSRARRFEHDPAPGSDQRVPGGAMPAVAGGRAPRTGGVDPSQLYCPITS